MLHIKLLGCFLESATPQQSAFVLSQVCLCGTAVHTAVQPLHSNKCLSEHYKRTATGKGKGQCISCQTNSYSQSCAFHIINFTHYPYIQPMTSRQSVTDKMPLPKTPRPQYRKCSPQTQKSVAFHTVCGLRPPYCFLFTRLIFSQS